MSYLRIGLVYETFETYRRCPGDPKDAHVEFEPEATIAALEAAIVHLGHRPVRLGSPTDLLALISAGRSGEVEMEVDVVFNLCEGFAGRNREAWAPVLLEMADIPCIGSDALTLSLSLDKAWANRWLADVGIPVAQQISIASREAALQVKLPAAYPLFIKPRWEGTAKGIRPSSLVASREDLVREVERIVSDYNQPALVEAFIPGAEYTVTLIGNDPPHALPVLQRALERESGIGLHAVEGLEESVGDTSSGANRFEHETPGLLTPELESRLAELSIRAFDALDCRDFARLDFRLDSSGEPVFLEINPLPTFAPDGSFGILAELEGCSLDKMLGRCIQAGLIRLGLDGGSGSNE
ncbi:MAG TPA: D-alanine--D-alanine ligase [Myxococcales bacterium]|nr:D-alanine--D-alanine ligase [Myxococcales bacterium]